MSEDAGTLVQYSFAIDGVSEELSVQSMSGREKLSGPYSFDVAILTPGDPRAIAAHALGKKCHLVITVEGVARRRDGVVTGVSIGGRREQDGAYAMVFRFGPRFVRLRHRVDSRIFQFSDVKKIVDAVLQAAGVTCEWKLVRQYSTREYCTQYRESDLAFVERLLAEEGIFYYFEQPGPDDTGTEKIVFIDDVGHYPAIDEPDGTAGGKASPTLVLRDGDAHLADDNVSHFGQRVRTRSGAAMYRDYDSAKPTMDLRTNTGSGELEIYDHDGYNLSPHWELDQRRAAIRVGQASRDAVVSTGRSGCARIHAGRRFTLNDEHSGQFDGEYVVVAVEHRGEIAPHAGEARVRAAYANDFRCVQHKVPWLLKPKRRPRIHACLTATVVGPPGEEIFINALGQVRVKFHWDRLGKADEHASCWIRVMQPWAGSQWGAQFIPRVGMEVVIGFDDGNPDKPVALGTVYNGTHNMPFPLHEKTKSGFVTKTYAGSGKNALVFDDANGAESVELSGQRDLHLSAKGDYDLGVGGTAKQSVKGDLSVSVKGSLKSTSGAVTSIANGARTEVTRGPWTHSITANVVQDVLGQYTLHGRQRVSIAADGGMAITVGTLKAPAEQQIVTYGTATIGSTDAVQINAKNGIVFTCGKSSIRILQDKIELTTDTLSIKAGKSVSAASGGDAGPSLTIDTQATLKSKKVTLMAEKATLEMDDQGAKLKGAQIQLDCDPEKPPAPKTDEEKAKTKDMHVQLTDANMKPLKSLKYNVLVGGQRLEGTTDGDGMVQQTVPLSAQTATIIVWLSDYPTGPQNTYQVDLVEAMPAVETVSGAKLRLRNLGYYSGAIDDSDTGDFQQALTKLQLDFGLERTGKLDPDTLKQLEQVHIS